jgi:hypothetical protein
LQEGGLMGDNFNERHPELRQGEVWITNEFEHDSWQVTLATARRGEVAYSILGKPIAGGRPVFAQQSELDESRRRREALYAREDHA